MTKNQRGKEIKVTEYGNGKGAKIDIYSPDSKTKPHDTIHIKVDTEQKTYQTVTKIDGEKETSSGGCYLTPACMNHFQEDFDDNCYELSLLRWFRDTFVTKEDIEYYYQIAPKIVETIEHHPDCDAIYRDIYGNIIDFCVKAIEEENYVLAYDTYKNSVFDLEETYAKSGNQQGTTKTLNRCLLTH